MARRPDDQWKARIKYVPTPDAPQRYAEALKILFRAKKRMEQRKSQGIVDTEAEPSDGDADAA